MAAKSKTQRRKNKPVDPYKRKAPPVQIADEAVRFTLLHGNESRPAGGVLTAVHWDDTGMELTGTLEAQASLQELQVRDGDRLRCEVSPSLDGVFRRVWTLLVSADAKGQGLTRTFESDTTSADLASMLPRYRANTMDLHYRKDKSHPRGWTCDQIARDVAHRAGIPLGRIAKGTHPIKNLVRRNADPVDVILIAYRQEREATGRRFFASWNGRLSMTVLTRSPYVVELLPVLLSAAYTTRRRDDFATVLDVRATARDGKRKTRKVRVRVVDKAGVRQFGEIVKSVSPKGIDSEAEARRWARASLARRRVAKRELTVTVPLMPTIQRGAAARIDWPDSGLKQVVYVRSASHDWNPGSGTTTLVMRFDDPFVDKRQTKTAKAKQAAAKKRGRKVPKASSKKPRPKTAARRANK
jgi:hypothetical protein